MRVFALCLAGMLALLCSPRLARAELVTSIELRPDESMSIQEGLDRLPVLPGSVIPVVLHAGTYRITEPIRVTPKMSGDLGQSLVIRPFGDGEVVIDGGMRITGWTQSGPHWVADVEPGSDFSGLYLNGERLVPARMPNDGDYFHTDGKVEDGALAKRAFRFKEGDLPPFRDLDSARLVAFHAWETSAHRIESIDAATRTVTLKNDAWWPFEQWGGGQRYYVENVFEGLDQPGEWYLDSAAGNMYCIPPAGVDMNAAEVVAPVAEQLLVFEGDPADNQFVDHVRIEGVQFRYSNFNIGADGHSDPQAAQGTPAAIEMRGARDCALVDCAVAHTGGYGIWLREGCTRNLVQRNEVYDLGAGGIRVGGKSKPVGDMKGADLAATHNTIDNNYLHAGGRVFRSGVGVFLQHSSYSTVSHNEIADFFYTGVSNGWVWGYGENPSHHNIIEYNHIHHIGQRVMSDMGGIYNLGIQPGTILRYNRIHDIYSFHYGGWGLYTDEGSTEMLLENNVVYNTTNGSFHQHYGRNNRIRNNIFVNADSPQVVVTRVEPHRSFVFERNIVVSSNGTITSPNWPKADIWADGNLYWDLTGKPLDFTGMDFAAWQATGHDLHSIVADPRFVDAENHDYRLRPDSPALAMGFEPIDLSRCGLYGDPAWVGRPDATE